MCVVSVVWLQVGRSRRSTKGIERVKPGPGQQIGGRENGFSEGNQERPVFARIFLCFLLIQLLFCFVVLLLNPEYGLNLGCLHPVACVRSGDGGFYPSTQQ
jgi:hypothetical protein